MRPPQNALSLYSRRRSLKRRRFRSAALLAPTALGLVFCCPLFVLPGAAQQANWTGGEFGDWHDGNNWSTGAAPQSGQTVIIGNGDAVIYGSTGQGGVLNIGQAAGTASLTVLDGAALNLSPTVQLRVGSAAAATGSLIVNGGDVVAPGRTEIGGVANGYGRLEILNGGTLTSNHTSTNYIGYDLSSGDGSAAGEVLIDGEGSTWSTTRSIEIGDVGTGRVTVQNGGLPSVTGNNNGIGLADHRLSSGELTVDGPGSTVIAAPSIMIGTAGYGRVEIRNGGRLESDAAGGWHGIGSMVGYRNTAEGHVLVTGENSVWQSAMGIAFGLNGTGTLAVTDGGQVTTAGVSYLGHSNALAHGEAVISGSGSTWTTLALGMG